MSAGWRVATMDQVCTLINGRAYSKSELLESGKYPVLRVGNFFTNNHWYHSDLELEPEKYCEAGDLLYAWSASFGPRIWAGEKCIFHYHIWKVIPIQDVIDKRFLFMFLDWDVQQIKSKHGTGTTMIHVSKGSMEQREIRVPPLPEQRRIVAILDEAFASIAIARSNAEKNLRNARELFESCLEGVFSKIAEEHGMHALGELCDRITKGSSPKWQGIDYVDRPGVLFVTSENVGEYELLIERPKYVETKFNQKDKKSILMPGDVLTNIVGASIGRTALFELSDVANINQAVCLLRCLPNVLHNRYLMHLLNSPMLRHILHENEVDNARANLSLSFFSRLQVPLPPVQEQLEVTTRLDELRKTVISLESIYQRKLAALDELKQSLLHEAFGGRF